MRLRLALVATLAGALIPVVAPASPCAAAPRPGPRAGLIVTFDAGAPVYFCIPLDRPGMTGYDLLLRSGLKMDVQTVGDAVAVCAIRGEGTAYPRQPCLPPCAGTTCPFWGYYIVSHGRWTFADVGPASHPVRDGDVEGWRYAIHSSNGGGAPPSAVTSLGTVCALAARAAGAAAKVTRSGVAGPVAGVVVVLAALAAAGFGVLRARRRAAA